jgi:hypothetical protein
MFSNTVYKLLAQATANANSQINTVIYTVRPGANAVISTFVICNRSNVSSKNYTIALQANGATLNTSQYIAYNAVVPASDTIGLTLGATLGANDSVTTSATDANITFTIFGTELS